MGPNRDATRSRREMLAALASVATVPGCSTVDTGSTAADTNRTTTARAPTSRPTTNADTETAPLAGAGEGTCTPSPTADTDRTAETTPGAGTTTATGTRSSTPVIGPERFGFDVSVLQGFDREHPARLEITFTNEYEVPLVGKGGPAHTLPFVDDDYVGRTESNEPGLILVPDNEYYFSLVEEGGNETGLRDVIPTEPTDGCWKLLFDWPPEGKASTAILHKFELAPGESITHGYSLYHLNRCQRGTYSFEGTVKIESRETRDVEIFTLILGFDLTLTETCPEVSVHDPRIRDP